MDSAPSTVPASLDVQRLRAEEVQVIPTSVNFAGGGDVAGAENSTSV